MQKFPNLHVYSENIRKRPVKSNEFQRLAQKNLINFKENDEKDAEISLESLENPLFFRETPENPTKVQANAKKPSRNREILQLLRETEAQALTNYEKIKGKARSRLLVARNNGGMANVVGFTLQKIKEISEDHENSSEIAEIERVLQEDRAVPTNFGENTEKFKRFLSKKIKEDWLVPITSKEKRGKAEILSRKFKEEEISKLKQHKKLGKDVEAILLREPGHYMKQIQEFLKENKLSLP